jgi:hypothetical protein
VRFVDLLKTTVLLSAGAATTLAVLTVAGATQDDDSTLIFIAAGWWTAAAIFGAVLGRRAQAATAIARLLADAKAATMLPEHRPGAVVANRLWPLIVSTVVAGGLTFLAPQIPGIAAGFAIIWSLAWRRQDAAVLAIEERDGVTFFVEQTSPLRPIRLVRTPGFRREVPSLNGSSTPS